MLAISTAIAFGGIIMFLTYLAVRSMRRAVTTGPEGMVGETGFTVAAVHPAGGTVMVRGEYWQARAATSIEANAPIRVAAVNGLTLVVEPAGVQTSGVPEN